MRFLIAYDISDDARRYRAATLLLGHGVRIQRSVYECDLDRDELKALLSRLEALVEGSWDVVHAFPACASCLEGVRRIGAGDGLLDAHYYIL